MPETAVRYLIKEGFSRENSLSDSDKYGAICLTSDIFNVSKQAAYYRLCDLGYIRQPLSEFEYQQLSLF